MAISLSNTLTSLKDQIAKTPQLILEVEGLDSTFSSSIVFELARWDNLNIRWDDGVTRWDGTTPLEGNEPLINLKASQRTLSQQIRPDRASTQSVPTFNIEIVDKDNRIAQQFSFDNIDEQLSKKVNVFLNLEGGKHPQDSIPIIYGFLDEFTFKAGSILMSVSHASNLQRQEIYTQATTELTAIIDDITTTIPVASTAGFIQASDIQKSFLQIDDEIMQIVSSSSNSFTVTRGALGTQAVGHEDADVLSYYTLSGFPIQTALKLMLSDPDNRFRPLGFELDSIEFVSTVESYNNAFIFNSYDIEEYTGLVQGDTLRIIGSASNDGDYGVLSFGKTTDGRSYVVVDAELTTETSPVASAQYSSQFNVLNEGLALENREVDCKGMLETANNFSSEFFEYSELAIKDSIENAKDFIEKQLYFPQNLYSIPRKARVSAKYTIPPLSVDITPTLNSSNIKNIEKLSVKRSVHKYYYNAVRYNYNKGFIEDKFFKTRTVLSGKSSRIRTGKSVLSIPADGLRQSSSTDVNLDRFSRRLLERYELASLEIKNIEVLFKDSINLEVGDIIPFGGADTQIPDPQTGKRTLPVKLYEIINRSLNIENGRVRLDLIETGFSVEGVTAVVAPSSLVAQGSTNSEIIVKEIIDTDKFSYERQKYEQLLGAKIRVRSSDYTFDESSILIGFSGSNQNSLTINPPLSTAPLENYIFELDVYQGQPSNEAGDLVKIKYSHFMVQKNIEVVTDNQTFDVDDTTGLFVGQEISVHSPDYSDDSFETTLTIDSIVGSTITLNSTTAFNIQVGYKLETYSFFDNRDGYVIL